MNQRLVQSDSGYPSQGSLGSLGTRTRTIYKLPVSPANDHNSDHSRPLLCSLPTPCSLLSWSLGQCLLFLLGSLELSGCRASEKMTIHQPHMVGMGEEREVSHSHQEGHSATRLQVLHQEITGTESYQASLYRGLRVYGENFTDRPFLGTLLFLS